MPKESTGEFKARINNYNIKHSLETGEIKQVKGSVCMFCGKYEHGHPRGIEYVCSNCTILLLNATQEDKRKAYDKAMRVNSKLQAKALLMFIIPKEDIDEPGEYKTRNNAGRINRKRSVRHISHEKERA